jgi:phage gpG-like protein
LKKRLLNLKPAYQQIADNFRELEDLTFRQQVRARPWVPLSPAYAAWKQKHHPGKPILVLTGDLRKSLVSKGSEHIEKIGRRNMEIGTSNKTAVWHQFGVRKNRLPIRHPIKPLPKDWKEWRDIMFSYIKEKLGFKR